MSADTTPGANALLDLAHEAAAGAASVVPRLVERSRRQVRFATTVLSHVPCVSRFVPADRQAVPDADVDPVTDATATSTVPASVNGSDGAANEPQPLRPRSGPAAEGLAITDYDSLAASQVLPRLDGLSPEELEAVRTYESDHRGRRTILGRIAQLQA